MLQKTFDHSNLLGKYINSYFIPLHISIQLRFFFNENWNFVNKKLERVGSGEILNIRELLLDSAPLNIMLC